MAIINKQQLVEIGQAVAKGEKVLIEHGPVYRLIAASDFVKGTHRKVCTCKLKVGDTVIDVQLYDKDKSKKQSKKSDSERNGDQESRPENGSLYGYDDQA